MAEELPISKSLKEIVKGDKANEPFKIEHIHAFIAEDEDGVEGVCAFHNGDSWHPMIAADKDRFDSLRPIAEQLVEATGKPVKVLRFSSREEVETINKESK